MSFEERVEEEENKLIHYEYVKRLQELPFFHPGLSRNTAEALLLQNATEGTYLLRNRSNKVANYSLSVRCQNSVRHFTIDYDRNLEAYKFGLGLFHSIAELIDHFQCQPVIGGKSETPIRLSCPYLRVVEEPNLYETVSYQTEMKILGCAMQRKTDFQIGSKEGYLVKRGAIRKNWKKRWFVLEKDLLKYFKNKKSNKPLKTIDLKLATHLSKYSIDNKEYCFNLVLPKRTYYICASCLEEEESWVNILQWKISHYLKLKESKDMA